MGKVNGLLRINGGRGGGEGDRGRSVISRKHAGLAVSLHIIMQQTLVDLLLHNYIDYITIYQSGKICICQN